MSSTKVEKVELKSEIELVRIYCVTAPLLYAKSYFLEKGASVYVSFMDAWSAVQDPAKGERYIYFTVVPKRQLHYVGVPKYQLRERAMEWQLVQPSDLVIFHTEGQLANVAFIQKSSDESLRHWYEETANALLTLHLNYKETAEELQVSVEAHSWKWRDVATLLPAQISAWIDREFQRLWAEKRELSQALSETKRTLLHEMDLRQERERTRAKEARSEVDIDRWSPNPK